MENKKEPVMRGTKIQEILSYFTAGKTVEEIVALGYNKSTVKIQHAKYLKLKA